MGTKNASNKQAQTIMSFLTSPKNNLNDTKAVRKVKTLKPGA